MAKTNDYTEITPVDPLNPFRNPTEEPDYSPDYRELLPEIDMPGSSLPLFPGTAERNAIRRNYSVVFLILLFAFVVTASVYTGGKLLVTLILRQIDLRAGTELPGNYMLIAEQFFADTSVSAALTCIAFLIGNLSAFYAGNKIMRTPVREYFRTRAMTPARAAFYALLAVWVQLIAELAAGSLTRIADRAGIDLHTPEMTLNGSLHRTLLLGFYACIVAPVTEELLLRGFVLKQCCRVSQRTGIMLSALLFAVMHENIPQILFAFPLGILLAYITIQHNSLTPAIIVHITVNCFAFARSAAQYMLPLSTWRRVDMISTLTVVMLGTIAFLFLCITERLPVRTPHQSIRGLRIIASSPMIWVLLTVHFLSAVLAMR